MDIPQRLQDLPPKWAHFCLHIEQFITDDLDAELNGKKIVVGFSGGIDSTVLLLVLHYLRIKNKNGVIAVHLNHQLRPEAVDDAQWVGSFCQSLAIPCIIENCDVASLSKHEGIGFEEAGRKARYSLFNRVLQDEVADYIALGHHLDDLCEDVLMRLMRGTGWPGLSGMSGYDRKRKLIRPLLNTPKSALTSFLKTLGVPWREDASNAVNDWTRNRIRNDILPLFFRENPNFADSINRLWKIGRIEDDFWASLTPSASESISNELLSTSHQALRLRLYKSSLDALGPGQALADNLFKLDRAWLEKRFGATFQFPGEKSVTITVSGLVFSRSH